MQHAAGETGNDARTPPSPVPSADPATARHGPGCRRTAAPRRRCARSAPIRDPAPTPTATDGASSAPPQPAALTTTELRARRRAGAPARPRPRTPRQPPAPPREPTRGSSTLGTMRSTARSSPTTEKIASAAATFIFSVMRRAPASSAPRNTPGNASTLLIWFGKSLRPVATTAAYLLASSGWISGSGLDSANTMRIGRHRRDELRGHDTGGQPEEHVGALERLGHSARQAVRIRLLGDLRLVRVEVAAVLVQDALRVQQRDVANSLGQQDLCAGDTGGAGTGDDHPQRGDVAVEDLRCADAAPPARRSRCRAGRRASPGSPAPR